MYNPSRNQDKNVLLLKEFIEKMAKNQGVDQNIRVEILSDNSGVFIRGRGATNQLGFIGKNTLDTIILGLELNQCCDVERGEMPIEIRREDQTRMGTNEVPTYRLTNIRPQKLNDYIDLLNNQDNFQQSGQSQQSSSVTNSSRAKSNLPENIKKYWQYLKPECQQHIRTLYENDIPNSLDAMVESSGPPTAVLGENDFIRNQRDTIDVMRRLEVCFSKDEKTQKLMALEDIYYHLDDTCISIVLRGIKLRNPIHQAYKQTEHDDNVSALKEKILDVIYNITKIHYSFDHRSFRDRFKSLQVESINKLCYLALHKMMKEIKDIRAKLIPDGSNLDGYGMLFKDKKIRIQ